MGATITYDELRETLIRHLEDFFLVEFDGLGKIEELVDSILDCKYPGSDSFSIWDAKIQG